jgi:hypothetical protein
VGEEEVTGVPAVAPEILERCKVIVHTPAEWKKANEVLSRFVKCQNGSVQKNDWGLWTKQHLMGQFGFEYSNGPTVVAVSTGEQADNGSFLCDIQYLYIPDAAKEVPGFELTAMAKAAEAIFEANGAVKTEAKNVRGLSDVSSKRGGTKVSRGTMLMAGTHYLQFGGGVGSTYNPSGTEKPEVFEKVVDHALTGLYSCRGDGRPRCLRPAQGHHRCSRPQ